jgi:Sulfotransferase family
VESLESDNPGEAPLPDELRLPDFLCIGAMRAGTTSLWKAFQAHPDLYLPETKELHFFDDRDGTFGLGIGWYARHFAGAPAGALAGEVSPSYLYLPGTAERIRSALPDVRLVAILRDPVARAWSHYWFNVRNGRERLSFEDAIDQEPERTSTGPLWDAWYSYLARGRYVDQLRRYEAVFTREQICVVFLEELRSDAAPVLDSVFEHVGAARIGSSLPLDEVQSNRGSFPRSRRLHVLTMAARQWAAGRPPAVRKFVGALTAPSRRLNRARGAPKLSPETRRDLNGRLASSNAELSEWLGRDLPWSEAAAS